MLTSHFAIVIAAASLVACGSHATSVAPSTPACVDASTTKAAANPPNKAPDKRAVYRLDFTFAMNEPGKAPRESTYALILEEHSVGEVAVGENVALAAAVPPPKSPAPSSSAASSHPFGPRQNVGFRLKCSFSLSGDALLLQTDLEDTSIDVATAIRRVSIKGEALVTPGRPVVVSSTEAPESHLRYQLTVSSTKLL